YGLKVDVWAAGVITYILLCGFPPFRSESSQQEELFEQILEGRLEYPSPYWDPISHSVKNSNTAAGVSVIMVSLLSSSSSLSSLSSPR
ncbi:hypothetical protein CRUP_021851, partial [Coryphaenoides rupestris]